MERIDSTCEDCEILNKVFVTKLTSVVFYSLKARFFDA